MSNRHCFTCRCWMASEQRVMYLYKTWDNIKYRTLNTKSKDYHRYGARGIRLYEPWSLDFMKFQTWILDTLGHRPVGHSLDRIDNDKGYEPGNLRWATPKEQIKNRQRT